MKQEHLHCTTSSIHVVPVSIQGFLSYCIACTFGLDSSQSVFWGHACCTGVLFFSLRLMGSQKHTHYEQDICHRDAEKEKGWIGNRKSN
jgi:hypothetical protein